MDEEQEQPRVNQRQDEDASEMPDVHYLPDDWFDEPVPPPRSKPWGARPWVVAIAIILMISLVLYYTIPILVPVREDKSKIPLNEQVYSA